VVTLKPNTMGVASSFSGVLYAEDRAALVLREAVALRVGERADDVPLDGELVLLLVDVDYIQRPNIGG